MPLERKQLDTASLHAKFPAKELPAHQQFGKGERYSFGPTHVDIYPLPPSATPTLMVRGRRNRLAVGDVYKVEPTDTNGLHALYVDGELVVNANGNYVNVYTAPDPELLGLQEAPEGQKRRDRRGTEYTQTMLDTSGTKEGERVETWGMVEAAPKPVNRGKNSPLQFFLEVPLPDKEDEKERWEVYASNKAKQQVKGRKLTKDDRIHAVLYKHTWTVDLHDGSETTHTRYNLATVIEVEKHDAGVPAKRHTVNAPTS